MVQREGENAQHEGSALSSTQILERMLHLSCCGAICTTEIVFYNSVNTAPQKCHQNTEQFIKDLKNMGCSRKKYYLVARCNSNYFTFGMKSNRCNGTVCEKKQPMNSSERETNIHMKRNKNIYSKCYKSNLEKKRRDSQ